MYEPFFRVKITNDHLSHFVYSLLVQGDVQAETEKNRRSHQKMKRQRRKIELNDRQSRYEFVHFREKLVATSRFSDEHIHSPAFVFRGCVSEGVLSRLTIWLSGLSQAWLAISRKEPRAGKCERLD